MVGAIKIVLRRGHSLSTTLNRFDRRNFSERLNAHTDQNFANISLDAKNLLPNDSYFILKSSKINMNIPKIDSEFNQPRCIHGVAMWTIELRDSMNHTGQRIEFPSLSRLQKIES
jgi:hypothetical protein